MNHYERLKVTPDAPAEVIRAAYRALAAKLHPDRQQAPFTPDQHTHDQMAALNTAYETLVDPALRAQYDATLLVAALEASEASASSLPAHGFSPTKVDIGWGHQPSPGHTSRWPPSPRMLMLMGAGGVVLSALVAVLTWQVMSRLQMERALSEQYTAHPQPVELPIEPPMPPALPPALRPLNDDLPQKGASEPAEGAASRPAVTAPGGAEVRIAPRMPTVAELAKMTDEELLQVLPTLGTPGMFVPMRPRRLAVHHPLDGNPLSLRTEQHLVDPLAPPIATP